MTARLPIDDQNALSLSSSRPRIHHKNVFGLLARREISPRTRGLKRSQFGETSENSDEPSFCTRVQVKSDAKRELISWAEAESLRHLSAKYCPLVPSPKSTIAAAFSPDGKTLASTHGDHTVKIIDCQTGRCLKVLNGHRRTPWVVRFHPTRPEILASGSLDHEVRLWNANTSECIGSRSFYRPIASIAFHAEGEILAIASGHKLYLWQYNKRGESSTPKAVLKTKRSLRAVHFHPHAASFLLTAEVNDLDVSDSTMTRATSLGCLQYPPAVYLSNASSTDRISSTVDHPPTSLPVLYIPPLTREESRTELPVGNTVHSSTIQVESSAPVQFQIEPNATEQYDPMVPSVYPISSSECDMVIDTTETAYAGNSRAANSAVPRPVDGVSPEIRQHPTRDPISWELPFLQGWLVGQSQNQTVTSSLLSNRIAPPGYSLPYPGVDVCNGVPVTSLSMSGRAASVRDNALYPPLISSSGYWQIGSTSTNNNNNLFERGQSVPVISRIQSELASSLAATSAAELPCTVKLRIWPRDLDNLSASVNTERSRLTIPHAVLCSEMGAHFSPCGRYLAACVACVVPETEECPGLDIMLPNQDVIDVVATSPTQHPISARRVMYELRIYSLEEPTFGWVLISTAVRAAHCLTSIQFSPTSEHILLAYGRRHSSLLKSVVINGESSIPIYTALEVYRVSDMELVSVLPSAEDEVNVACFHPSAGGGLVYGTKEGKLRMLQHDGAYDLNYTRPNFFLQENMVEVQMYALEC